MEGGKNQAVFFCKTTVFYIISVFFSLRDELVYTFDIDEEELEEEWYEFN